MNSTSHSTRPRSPASATVLRVEDVRKRFRTGPPWRRRTVEVLGGASRWGSRAMSATASRTESACGHEPHGRLRAEQLRAPFALALLVVVPALFVIAAAGALSDLRDGARRRAGRRCGDRAQRRVGTPGGIAVLFPEYGAGRVVIDGGFSSGFNAWGQLALALGWLAALNVAVSWALRRQLRITG